MNSVQENIYAIFNILKKKQEASIEESKFEQQLFINNTSMYREYMKRKQEDIDSGNADVEWLAPENAEEEKDLENIFADIDKRIKEDSEEKAANEEFVKQIGLMEMLGGINIDEIGGD